MMIRISITYIIILVISANCYPQTKEKYQLRSINFEGNNEYSSSTLSSVIYSEESPGWFWQFLNSFTSFGKGPVYFDSSNIQIDLSALHAYYNANGYFETRISYKYNIDSADKDVDLTYILKENKRSKFGNDSVSGIQNIPSDVKENFKKELAFDKSQWYSQSVVQQNIDQAVNTLLNSGYMLAKFDSTIIIRDTVSNLANMDIYFTPGKRYHIDSVIVNKSGEGASEVKDMLLRDITDIRKGDYYSLEKIRQRQIRLYRTGLFNSVILSTSEKDTSGNGVPLQLNGSIGLMNELSPEIILNNQNNFFNVGLSTSYIRKNFLGNARKLTISPSFAVQNITNVDFAQIFKKFSLRDTTLLGYLDARVTIDQPYLFSKPIFGTWENYAQVNKQSDYNLTIYGSKLTFEFELPKYTFINFLSTYYNIEVTKENDRIYHIPPSTKLISLIGADFGRTTANDLLFPTQGYNISMQAEHANLLPYIYSKIAGNKFDDVMFYKLVLSSSFYFALDLKRNNIFAVKAKIGQIRTYMGDYSGIPLNQTFYVGGSNSVRGWRANELHPMNAPEVQNYQGVNVKGGTFLIEGSFEYRYRFLSNFGVVLFYDYGNTWIGYKPFRYDELAQAIGPGFRYYTQIAPFRIDFGFKFYDPIAKKYIWNNWNKHFFQNLEVHFGIGEAF
ncbi:MAG: BamA/TamA family outer membrane protein [Ignavibacteriaceae bacterium]